jgi:hypothetical protein
MNLRKAPAEQGKTSLRLAAERALEALESLDCGDTYKTHSAASALRQALDKPEIDPQALVEMALAYIEQALAQHDQQYQRHPSTERDRQVIVNDLEALRQALAEPDHMIKTWQQRCEEHPDHAGIVSDGMIWARMQEEIDELRQALDKDADEWYQKALWGEQHVDNVYMSEERMTDLRQAAEMALQYFEDAYGLEDTEVAIKEALRQALDDKPAVKTYAGGKPNYCTPEVTREVPCKTDPRAPHGFDRNASHSADRYVCECEGWEPVEEPFIYVREDNEKPFGGYEHCSEADAGAFPVYLAPPKQEYQYEVVAEHANGTYTTRRIPKRDSSSWVGLTTDEIWKCNKAKAGSAVEFHICSAHQNVLDFAEAIEAKLKEKNGG